MRSKRRLPRPLTPFVFALAFFASGCGDSATTAKPASADVAGTWELDEAGHAAVRSAMKRGVEPAFTLRPDGTFAARDLPDWWNDILRPASPGTVWVPTTGSGRWDLRRDANGAWVVEAEFSALPGHPRGIKETLQLYRQGPPYRIGVILGDPDEGRFLIFNRTSARLDPLLPREKSGEKSIPDSATRSL